MSCTPGASTRLDVQVAYVAVEEQIDVALACRNSRKTSELDQLVDIGVRVKQNLSNSEWIETYSH